MIRQLLGWVLLCICGMGCKENASKLVLSPEKAAPAFRQWDTHRNTFSFAATPTPKQLRYQHTGSCPLRYMVAYRYTNQLPMPTPQPPQRIAMELLGEWSLTTSHQAQTLRLAPLWLRLTRPPHPPKGLALHTQNQLAQRGPLLLKQHTTTLQLIQSNPGQRLLWDAPMSHFPLSRLWPELSQLSPTNKRTSSTRHKMAGVTATRTLHHSLLLKGQTVTIIKESMHIKQSTLTLTQTATYALLKQGHLLFSHFQQHSQTRIKGTNQFTTTQREAELRLLQACHPLRLPPFLNEITPAEWNKRQTSLRQLTDHTHQQQK